MELNSNMQIYFDFFFTGDLFADATVLCILTNISAAPPWTGFEFNLLTRVIIFLKIIDAATPASKYKEKTHRFLDGLSLIFSVLDRLRCLSHF